VVLLIRLLQYPGPWTMALGILFVVHLVLLGMPMVNLEWAFISASEFFRDFEPEQLNDYFTLQANTLGFPFLLQMATAQTQDWETSAALARTVSLFGLVLAGLAIHRLMRIYGCEQRSALALVMTFVCPLVWVYSARATADFLPASVAVLSVVIAIGAPRSTVGWLVSFALLGVATVLKYHAAAFMPVILASVLMSSRDSAAKRILLGIAGVAIMLGPVLAYLLWVHQVFGFWVTPPAFLNRHQAVFDLSHFANAYIGYTAYLFLLVVPLSVAMIWEATRRVRSLLLVAGASVPVVLAGILLIKPGEELNFGPADRFLAPSVVGGLFLLFSVFFHVTVFAIYKRFDRPKLGWEGLSNPVFLCLVIIGFLLVLSSSRPSQRYLLYVLPFYCVLLTVSLRRPILPALGVFAISMAGNVFIALSQLATGQAALAMTQRIESGEVIDPGRSHTVLLREVDPGAVLGHVGHLYPIRFGAEHYIIVPGVRSDALHVSRVWIAPYIERRYSLVAK
jgi:hypothetical protein